ncbi:MULTISPECIES: autotransporter domain-containing protein [unclassified Novosphingobium]|uniref:autotransporter outer membrane beta-barrel domain-containing protein n=1 Tax=unclassified Novosphingobium TaxID=2644732 RepID=UPI00135BF6AB|nr:MULTISPECIES: autotransporter outer membrane beta-barrel domain-containing protein [unclassified Novosphingobium]
MASLHTTSSLGALVLALVSAPALADTTVSGDTVTPLSTSSAGNITVKTAGSIALASGSGITLDSNSTAAMNGTIEMGGSSNTSGISIVSGTTSTVTVGDDATISVLEDYVLDDDDSDGIVTRGIASASNRYGIHSAGDAAGTILNDGAIKVEGQNSGGIVLGGDWTGNVTNTGTISVIGDNSFGLSTQGVDGNVTVEGVVSAVGYGSSAVAINGDVTGALTIQGTVTKGYSYTNDDGDTMVLSRAALRTGTAAVSVTGNVAGGIYIAAPPVDDDSGSDDIDGDGVDDSDEGTGVITAYGNGAALQIGGSSDITIGSVAANVGTYSLALEGSITANSYYSNTAAYGVVIGGQGGDVTLTDGIGVSGTLSATSYDTAATALLINEGSTVTSLYNSGNITASLTSAGEGTTVGIQDLSGSLTSLVNTGYISANGSSTDSRTAIDLSANTSGVTITQYLNDADAETRAEYVEDNDEADPTVYARIYGDILTGSGNDTITASTGQIVGDTRFGAGDDTLTLSDDAAYTGDVYFDTGTGAASLSGASTFAGTMDFAGEAGTVTINDTATYSGQFANAANVAVTVNGGTLIPDEAVTINFGSLHVASAGTIGVYVDGAESSTIVVDSAVLEDGASVVATVNSLATAEGTYTVLSSDSLTVNGALNASVDTPFLYNGSVSSDDSNIYLTLDRKTAGELGLTKSQAAGWDAIYSTAQNDDYITESLLQVEDSATLRTQTASLLPDHAGGVFKAVTMGDRLAARHISDETSMFEISDVGGWLEPVYWRASKEATGTASYKASGWGLSAGLERHTDLGYFGVSYAWLKSSVKDNGGTGDLDIGQHDFGAFWRTAKGPLMAWARLGASRISIDSTRTYTGTIDDTDFTYDADGSWKGWLFSGLLGASYKFDMSRRFSLKPKLELEQMWLKESGYDETADSDAVALSVASRTSRALTATPTVTAAYSLGTISPDWRPLTFAVEAGRREVLSGKLGTTTAYFNGGDSYDAGEAFSITGDSLKGAWVGEVSMLAGGYDFTWKIGARMEKTSTSNDKSLRASLSVAF